MGSAENTKIQLYDLYWLHKEGADYIASFPHSNNFFCLSSLGGHKTDQLPSTLYL